MKNLLIVESPAKASTIEKYLGGDFSVKSSVGHIRELPPGDDDAIDVAHDFAPKYAIVAGKKKLVGELKRAVKAADEVWLATDEDREGEAIAWHLSEVLGLNPDTTKRITFHEITKPALSDALKHPRVIDMDVVRAQQARQILDRLVGYELSPVVWKKVPGGKSAGRVQSPALRLVVEREREIAAFQPESSFKVSGTFCATAPNTAAHTANPNAAASQVPDDERNHFKADLTHTIADEATAHALLDVLTAANWRVADLKQSDGTRRPPAPFTTSTLQQEANSRLGFSARATMSAAQALYQAGHITYMRTDSTTLSKVALSAIASYLTQQFGSEYVHTRQFQTKSAGAQEAHEAIRPSNVARETAGKNDFERRLYGLIRARTLASQMAEAKIRKTTAVIEPSTSAERFEAKGEVIAFDGFLAVYGRSGEKYLPALTVGQPLSAGDIVARQTFSKPPGRYTEGSLVKKLEELGIGRPSTYATILENLKSRSYIKIGEGEGIQRQAIELTLAPESGVVRQILTERTGSDKGRLVPNAIGEVLSDFLLQYFSDIMDYGFTAHTETELDCIEKGTCNSTTMLHEFYEPFHQKVEAAADIDRRTVAKARQIGADPKTGKMVSARIGRFGPMLQLGMADDEEKPRFAKLPEGRTIDTVTLEESLEMFQLPRLLGQTPAGDDIKANVGRFGPYVQVGSLFASIPKASGLDPFTISLEQGLELYEEKKRKDAEKNIALFDSGIKVLRGRYGPYVTNGKKNVTIAKDIDPTTVTEAQAAEM
ncbi:MAG: type I DNA topoisomerase, partial [Actinomycetes bacterium]|nr:type I DNA topoisomerase [Actinomycetes bacterium]